MNQTEAKMNEHKLLPSFQSLNQLSRLNMRLQGPFENMNNELLYIECMNVLC